MAAVRNLFYPHDPVFLARDQYPDAGAGPWTTFVRCEDRFLFPAANWSEGADYINIDGRYYYWPEKCG